VITIITGPPLSGKSTYVRDHAKPRDVVIDFDVLAQALGSDAHHDHHLWIAQVTAAAWGAAVRRALAARGHDTWIIDTSPTPERARLYGRAGAVHVPCAVASDELKRRAVLRNAT
jgi:predicted kinase